MHGEVNEAIAANAPEIARAKPSKLNWEDPFLLEQMLSNDERMIRDTAAAYCQSSLLPRMNGSVVLA